MIKRTVTVEDEEDKRIPVVFVSPGFFQGKWKDSKAVNWVHKTCKKTIRIDKYGDLYCDNGCSVTNRFIQYWRFNCGVHHNGEYVSYKSISEMLQAIAITSYAIKEFYPGDPTACQKFLQELTKNLTSKWQDD